jgi:hypothetical protein
VPGNGTTISPRTLPSGPLATIFAITGRAFAIWWLSSIGVPATYPSGSGDSGTSSVAL